MCGIFFQYSCKKIGIDKIIDSLNKIQHRGQDSIGIAYKENTQFILKTEKGLVNNMNKIKNKGIHSNLFIGHLRYKTSGYRIKRGTQPILSENKFGKYAFVFNGNIPLNKYTHLSDYRYELDTDLITYFFNKMAETGSDWNDVLKQFIETFERAFSLILITDKNVFILKDRYGVRPISYKLDKGSLMISSETTVFDNKDNIHEINDGSLVSFEINSCNNTGNNTGNINININTNVIYSFFDNKKIIEKTGGICIFEYIYFLSPKAVWNTIETDNQRRKWGQLMATNDIKTGEFNNRNDYIVVGIPSTGIIPAKTYAATLDVQYSQLVDKNPTSNRTFILEDGERQKASKQKYTYNIAHIKDKKIIVIDDSIVRGITIKNIVSSLRDHGAKEVHLRIMSPPIRDICMYGIDIPKKDELIANNLSVNEINTIVGSDSLKFLETDEMLNSIRDPKSYCTGCFDSNYGNIKTRDKTISEKIIDKLSLLW